MRDDLHRVDKGQIYSIPRSRRMADKTELRSEDDHFRHGPGDRQNCEPA